MKLAKLAERKYTTKKGLKELKALIDKFEFYADINAVESKPFFARCERDNGLIVGDLYYKEWTSYQAKWEIKTGVIRLLIVDEYVYWENPRPVELHRIDQLNFPACIKALQEVIEKYNSECKKKDAQIGKFLEFCENWKGR